ncbi:M14 family metallopeptidase [Adhaeribacter pallidiroseus]|uniref:Dipeptidyl-peptidase IV n=1 Tax=Adhaeribacter pallidiroseus TaxID=2072847 RepID=A0A369QFL1_9BACT|nr:M14 family metallopeptidase [Adhaeribacter pallidiroseus]RDC62345.1 Dipeptidyl-peptidase IV [Adhaeribacter pallidiroseus]
MILTVLSLLLQITLLPNAGNWLTPYEKSFGKKTATYPECIRYYQQLDNAYDELKLVEYGATDSGKPLHLAILSLDKDYNPASVRRKNKRVLLIQNGIHPGEPEGIDASMMLARDYLQKKELRANLKNVVVLFIPIYNVDGSLNRNQYSRANQNGPESYGFRGNARNLDLNRDYIKATSRNAQTFAVLFREWQPDVFVDTHTSNGADYQHTMTLIATQKDKLQAPLRDYLTSQLLPQLYQQMQKQKLPMCPYVDSKGETPDTGLIGFLETPRYSTGYTTLFNTIGFVTETHMLKPFPNRVQAQYAFLDILIRLVQQDAAKIAAARQKADQEVLSQKQFALTWQLDTTALDSITFLGYAAKHKPSQVSGLSRLYYDRQAPFLKKIPYYNTYRPALTTTKPVAYAVPQAWEEVIDRLRLNRVKMRALRHDTSFTAEVYYIADYKTSSRPYEGHYLHSGVQVRTEKQRVNYFAGDYIITTNQTANRFLVETLEPQAVDSYFNWGFFDEILQPKEYFSSYVFEDIAAELLQKDLNLKKQLQEYISQNPEAAKSAQTQLDFIYRHSPYYEKSHLRYPISRIIN